MNELISIEVPCSAVTKMIAYCYHSLNRNDLNDADRVILKNLEAKLYEERTMLYSGNEEQVRKIVEKVNNLYGPFLKNRIDNDRRNKQSLSKGQGRPAFKRQFSSAT